MVSGLGHVYGGDFERPALRKLISALYRAAVSRAAGIFVFNGADRAEMLRHGIIRPDQRVEQVPGSGVDIHRFRPAPLPIDGPVFLMIARLMRDKGLLEFVAAARALRAQYPEARFRILGPRDSNPTAVSEAEIAAWSNEGVIEYLGECRDVAPHLRAASVFVLPSYYREGLPRTILEALASGRPVVTSTMPGCRDAVTDGWNGFLVPPRDSDALATALRRLIEDPGLIVQMGGRARDAAVQIYDVDKVNAQLLTAMGLTGRRPAAGGNGLGDWPLVERTMALMALLVLAPVLVGVGMAVFLSLSTPILFRQRRTGGFGRPFVLVKFRSMRPPCAGVVRDDAARLTRFGRALRRSRLDELPQLWNVLRGDLSLVGPRPLLPETIADMGQGGIERSSVRPGLTGWSQIHGNSLLVDADKLALDLWYVRNRSMRLDILILFRTIVTLVRGERVDSRQVEQCHASHSHRRG
jgi:lipopolysaccharide/colanic/teichoic acid biosynthesis glycosyltransferase